MNSRPYRAARAALAVLGLGVWLWACSAAPPAAPLAGAAIGGPFALIDQHGRPFTDRDLRGKYALIYFGYTFCPDVCPLDVQKLSAGLRAFEAAHPALGARVVPVFITVDPARDTPAALAQFAANFHPRLVALTGTPAAVAAAERGYRIYARRAGPPGAADYLIDHAALTYLMGPDGAPISFLGHDTTPAQVTAELATYVR